MRIAFVGHQEIGCATLAGLARSSHEVVLAVGHPPGGPSPYDRVWEASVAELAAAHGIPCLEARSVNEGEALRLLRATRPDVIVSADWRSRLDRTALDVPRVAAINLHDGLLPRYAGCAPLNWAIAAGEREVGATAHFMNEEIDMGDVILRASVQVDPDETATDVWPRLRDLFPGLALRALALLEQGSVAREPQVGTTYWHRRSEHDAQVDWRATNVEVRNLVRAQSDPYPNAYSYLDGRRVKIKRARLGDPRYRGTPGRVCARSPEGVTVLCGRPDGARGQALLVTQVEPEGSAPMPAHAFFERVGEQLGGGAR